MDMMDAARQLGKAIQQDPRYLAYVAARKANDADEALQELIGRFNLLKMQVDEAMDKEPRDEEKIASLNAELRKAYSAIFVNEHMQAYQAAKQELDEVVRRMNSIIDLCLAGENPDTCQPAENCTGSCATCGGCH